MRLVCLVPRLTTSAGIVRRGAEFDASDDDAARLLRRRQARPVRKATEPKSQIAPVAAPDPDAEEG